MKTFLGGPAQISPAQMRLKELSSVERFLSALGFEVKKEGSRTINVEIPLRSGYGT